MRIISFQFLDTTQFSPFEKKGFELIFSFYISIPEITVSQMANCSSGFGKRGELILITQLGRKFDCAKKECPLKRHPYFWKGRLFMWRSVSSKLSPGHTEYLKHGLPFDMYEAVLLE